MEATKPRPSQPGAGVRRKIKMQTQKQIISYIKTQAKDAGLTFRIQRNLKINGGNAYCFTVRGGGEVVMRNCTLGGALENVESGYIATWNPKTGYFDGL